jgi:hypothetical protein
VALKLEDRKILGYRHYLRQCEFMEVVKGRSFHSRINWRSLKNRSLKVISLLVCFFLLLTLMVPCTLAFAAGNLGAKNNISYSEQSSEFFEKEHILVKLKSPLLPKKEAELFSSIGAQVVSSQNKLGIKKIRLLGEANIAETLTFLRASPLVEFAELNFKREAAAITPNDTWYTHQWGIRKAEIDEAWVIEKGETNEITVAVLDTGVDTDHEDLAGKILPGVHFYTDEFGYELTDFNYEDDSNSGHGTSITGVIAAVTNNNRGIAGVSWGAKILPVKVLDAEGTGFDSDIARGIVYAVDHGAKVINMSVAGETRSDVLEEAVNYAVSNGAVLVAAVGNQGSSFAQYPAAYPNVIGVAATDSSDNHPAWSNYGSFVDVSAPGESIISTNRNNTYLRMSGTSIAAAFVSGLAALIFSHDPYLTIKRVAQIIRESADDLGTPGWDKYFGAGRINAWTALNMASDDIPPTVAFVMPVEGGAYRDIINIELSVSDDRDFPLTVSLVLDGKEIATLTSPPYEYQYDLSNYYGELILTAVATDIGGHVTSKAITIYKQTFTDVTPQFWAYNYVEYLWSQGIANGYPNGSFKPNNKITRAEFTKLLLVALRKEPRTSYAGYFSDVPSDYWASGYIEKAYEEGLINGYPDGVFRPANKISRAEMTAILVRASSLETDTSGPPFSDVSSDYWAYEYIMTAKNNDLIDGYPDGNFKPADNATRAEASKVIYKIYASD